ncbi:ATP binding family protein [Piedraia hortae CBS 480.64]|uniref:GPN-loop GTPase n=1 Tax=Piedraia hortae CBS 480.64 TaxID=1314780 RepID=A0A6A7C5X9_9PEZI|nr:ATP binding family protein [Piedraia hortae CBS 480.64]
MAATAIVCVGMAGSGKTTFMQRINAYLHGERKAPYVVNLDPAVHSVPFDSNIDIRDSVNYAEVMKQYNLGPNGAILTSLNLFSTKIDQVMKLLEKRCLPQTEQTESTPAHILIDTPGQIEVFVWSASGSILLSSLASSFPTVLAYVIDTPRTTENTATFMSNMLYAISIMYKTKLPMILVFNKADVKRPDEAIEWMRDFQAFQAALQREDSESDGSNYMNSLLGSMSLVLEEFYNSLSVVGVSALTGEGVEEFFQAVQEKREEFERDYKPEIEKRREHAREVQREAQDAERDAKMRAMHRMTSDMSLEPETVSEAESDDSSE